MTRVLPLLLAITLWAVPNARAQNSTGPVVRLVTATADIRPEKTSASAADSGAAPVQNSPQQLPPTGPAAAEPIPTPPPTAGPAPTLSLEAFEAMALSHNPTLAQASARVRALQGKWVQDGLYPNPRVFYKGDEMGDENTAGFQGVSVIQEIVTKHKLGLAQNITSQQISQAQQEYVAQEFRVRNDVKLRFYEVLLAQRALELNQELERVSRAVADSADELFKAAQVGRVDTLQARIEADTIQLQSIKARNFHQSAWRRLVTVSGMCELEFQPLVGDLRQDILNTTWEAAWQRLASASPELSAAQAKVNAARWAVSKACADRCPNLELESGYSHDNSTGFDTGSIIVTVPVPIFNRNQGNIRQAHAQLSEAMADLERVSLDLRNRLAFMFERYSNARELVERYEQSILPNAKESVDLASARYKAGETNFTGLLIAQRVYLQTQVAYLEALRELRETSVLIEGLLLSDSLAGLK